MSSYHHPGSPHLDATAGREVVFCHACSNEWYREDGGLICPRCQGEATEIIDPENDPRESEHNSSASTSPERAPNDFLNAGDSDPDEADIEEQMGTNGFVYRRSVRDRRPNQRPHNPNPDLVFERFIDMINGFGPQRMGRPTGMGLFDGDPDDGDTNNGQNIHPGSHPHASLGASRGPGEHQHYGHPQVRQTTFTAGPFGGGTTSVTIVSGPMPSGRGQRGLGGPRDPFQTIFSNLLRDAGPPAGANNEDGERGNGPPPGFARSLQDILNLINPANAMAGDAVYSQEALDRIITGLMEANPQSNAAPPATAEALKGLPRRTVEKSMLDTDGKTECSICIDDMKEGETSVALPCKHWFHEECVVLWLKEHNTCPICRTPIEKGGANPSSDNNDSQGGGGLQSEQNPGPGPSSSVPPPPDPAQQGSAWFPTFAGTFGGPLDGGPGTQSRPRYSRPPSQSQSRLNEALRNLSSIQRERELARGRDGASTSGFSYDTSRLQRRDSASPTSPRISEPWEYSERVRDRREPDGNRRTGADRDQRRPSGGSGPINWLRDRFSGGGGSGSGSSRDARRS
ncbi:hypothetical protein G7046_g9693 [Stylonectria norvegica]|nr:hypothetical protein G7046_g9693 [Stylonectria norvegica]